MSVFGEEAETPRRGGGTVRIRAGLLAAMVVGVILAGVGVFMAGLEIGRRQGVQEGIARMMPTSIPAEQVLAPEPKPQRRPRSAPPADPVAEASPTPPAQTPPPEAREDDLAGVPGAEMQASDLERRQTRPKGWEELGGDRPAPPGAGRSWAVQVLATPNEREALLLVQKLEAAGYPVFVTPTRKDGLTWHRVRVGTYGAQSEAKTVARDLQRRFELPTWVLE